MRALVPIAIVLLVSIGLAAAAERKLTGPEIEKLLAGNTVDGEVAKGRSLQYFDASGATTYHGPGEEPSTGRWRVTGDQYCSQWPPSDAWACYDVEGDPAATPATVTWIGSTGTRYPGRVMAGRKL